MWLPELPRWPRKDHAECYGFGMAPPDPWHRPQTFLFGIRDELLRLIFSDDDEITRDKAFTRAENWGFRPNLSRNRRQRPPSSRRTVQQQRQLIHVVGENKSQQPRNPPPMTKVTMLFFNCTTEDRGLFNTTDDATTKPVNITHDSVSTFRRFLKL